jgi:hypothetical protein
MMADLSRCSAEASRFEALGGAPAGRVRVNKSSQVSQQFAHANSSSTKSEHGRAHATKCVSVRNYIVT